MVKTVLQGV